MKPTTRKDIIVQIFSMIPKKQAQLGVAIGVVIFIVTGLFFYFKVEPPYGNVLKAELECDKSKVTSWRKEVIPEKITATSTKPEKVIIRYRCNMEEEVPAQTYGKLNEDISRRGEFFMDFPTEKGRYIRSVTLGEPLHKDLDEKWYETKSATSTEKDFHEATKLTWFEKNIIRPAWADATSTYTGGGDGYVYLNNTNWVDGRVAASGTGSNSAIGSDTPAAQIQGSSGAWYWASAFLPFYTALPSGSVVSSSTIHFRTDYIQDLDTGHVSIVGTNQASHVALGVDDWNNRRISIGSPTKLATDKPMSELLVGRMDSIVLNAAGRAAIKNEDEAATCGTPPNGWTCLGMNTQADVDNAEPATTNRMKIACSELAGKTQDPRLDIEYAEAAPEVLDDAGSQDIMFYR